MNVFTKTFAALALATPLLAFAQTPSAPSAPRIDQRQANQERRIDQGVQSGSLTQKEAARLEKGQDHVQNMEDKAKADGKVTRKSVPGSSMPRTTRASGLPTRNMTVSTI